MDPHAVAKILRKWAVQLTPYHIYGGLGILVPFIPNCVTPQRVVVMPIGQERRIMKEMFAIYEPNLPKMITFSR